MRRYLCLFTLLLTIVLLTACGQEKTNAPEKQISKTDTSVALSADPVLVDTINAQTTEEENYATYFIVIADTGLNYFALDSKMLALHQQLNIPVDTMGRYYNKAKDLIALPDNDEDEVFAGDYLPRRTVAENLSLEYLNTYQEHAGEKTIALVTGIYEKETTADSALAIIRRAAPNSFKLKAAVYIGCMH